MGKFLLKPLVTLVESTVGIIMLAATALVLANVLGRYLLGSPIAVAEEILQYMNIWIVILGSVVVVQHDAHLCLDLRPGHIPQLLRRVTNGAILLLGIGLSLYVILQSLKVIGLLRDIDQRSISADIPLYLVYLVIPVSFALSAVFLVRRFWFLVSGSSEKEANAAAGLEELQHPIDMEG